MNCFVGDIVMYVADVLYVKGKPDPKQNIVKKRKLNHAIYIYMYIYISTHIYMYIYIHIYTVYVYIYTYILEVNWEKQTENLQ
jgi:hypothetical protein